VCECGSEKVVLKGGFGAWEDGRWCGWVLGGPRWPSGGFSHTWPSKESLHEKLQEDTGKLQEENRETTGGLQEEAERNFCYFEGMRVGQKGGRSLG